MLRLLLSFTCTIFVDASLSGVVNFNLSKPICVFNIITRATGQVSIVTVDLQASSKISGSSVGRGMTNFRYFPQHFR
jgi:hypothetical protein